MVVLGVVPIFMSAGAAALPTLIAAVTSVAAILLKPREVVRVYRQNPKTVSISAIGILLLSTVGIWWWMTPAASASLKPAGTQNDWAAVAQEILNAQKRGKRFTAVTDAAASDVPYVLGRDFTRCAYAGGESPRQLVPEWSFKPEFTSFFSSPAVAGKRVYAAGAVVDVTQYNGMLACLDIETGKPLWQITQAKDEFLHAFFSSPAVTQDGKNVVIGEGLHEDHDCQLRCFDANTGQLRWAVKTSLHIESSPAIFKDMAVVGCGAIEGADGKPTGDAGHVLAVRISDGQELWRQPLNDPESSPAVDAQGIVYIGSGFNGNAVVAIRSESDAALKAANLDRIAWKTPVSQPVTSAITLIDDLVIAGAGNSDFVYQSPNPQGFVVALERATGKVRWQREFPDAVLGAIAARAGKLICPMRTGEVAALDLADGHVLWKTAVSGKAPILAGCAFTDKCVYAASSDGWLAVIAAGDGKILSKSRLNDEKDAGTGKSLSGPQVAGGRIIVGSETGGLRCFSGPGGTQ